MYDCKHTTSSRSEMSNKIFNKRKRRNIAIMILSIVVVYVLVLIYITNPFRTITIVRNPYRTAYNKGQIILYKNFDLKVKKGPITHAFGFVKSGVHILANVYFGSKKSIHSDSSSIIEEIYETRFNPRYPYIISGDHFSVLYPRSLGVFYLSALDPRIPTSETQWIARQKIILQTTAYILDVFHENGEPCTTIVPIGPRSVTCINVYSYPSDAIYSLLYGLKSLQTTEDIITIYPTDDKQMKNIYTNQSAKDLVKTHKKELQDLVYQYKNTVYSEQTGLIRKDMHLSGAKDIIRRESAFYDNVIYWKTLTLARDLNILNIKQTELDNLKKRIIKTYWYEEGGYFLEDLSEDSIKENYYSSDWLVVLFTGFLDPGNPAERPYFEKSIAYIRKEKLDEPFGLKYQQDNRAKRAFWPVRFFLRSYGGTAIWSFWGTEYTKLLILMSHETGNEDYATIAKQQLDAYKANIERYKGFPEVYNKNGEFLSNLFYKSVRQTGWVINYEQAQLLYQSLAQ